MAQELVENKDASPKKDATLAEEPRNDQLMSQDIGQQMTCLQSSVGETKSEKGLDTSAEMSVGASDGADERLVAPETVPQSPVLNDSELKATPEPVVVEKDLMPTIAKPKEEHKPSDEVPEGSLPKPGSGEVSGKGDDILQGSVPTPAVSEEEKEELAEKGTQDIVQAVTPGQSSRPQSPLTAPDPALSESADEAEDISKTVAVEASEEETMMEGAWADILGTGQLKKKILKRGMEKKRPQSGDVVKIKFSGKLADGSVVDMNEHFEFVLGDSEVIHAFDLIVALMELGEVCQMETAARFAYGEIGLPPSIPPNATILYEIELLDFKPEEAPDSLPLENRKIIGNAKRERGNWWYSRNEHSKAIICYRRALEFLDVENESSDDPPEKLQDILEDRLKVYNNMAAAQMKVEAYDAAIKSLDVVLKCQPTNVKALYRKGKVLAQQGKATDAIALLKKALTIEPNEKSIKADLARLEAKQKSDRLKETSLYKKMLGTPVAEKKTNEKYGYDKIKLPVPWTLMVGSVIAFAASYLAYKYRYA